MEILMVVLNNLLGHAVFPFTNKTIENVEEQAISVFKHFQMFYLGWSASA